MKFLMIIIFIFIIVILLLIYSFIKKYEFTTGYTNLKQDTSGYRYLIPYNSFLKKNKIKVFNGYDNDNSVNSNTTNILINGENKQKKINDLDIHIHTSLEKEGMYIPHYVQFFFSDINRSLTLINRKKIYKVPPLFCVYIYSNCNLLLDGVRNRENFFDILQRMSNNRVDALGKCKNKNKEDTDKNFVNNDVIFKKYKFVIAFENTFADNYITEKIILPFLGDSIPIYYGAPNILKYFNPERFINVRDYNSFEECCSYILSLSNDAILNILNKPVFKDNKLDSSFSILFGDNIDYNNKLCSIYGNLVFIKYTPINDVMLSSTCIKVIHLPDENIKEQSIKEQFEKLNIRFDFFNAIKGTEYIEEYKRKNYIHPSYINTIKAGQLGCFMSHLEIYYQLINDVNHDYYIIFEDDIILDNEFINYDNIIKNTPSSWDMLFFGVNKYGCHNTKKYSLMNNTCMPGGFAYAINKQACYYFLKYSLPIYEFIDVVFQHSVNNLNIYVYNIIDTYYEICEHSSTCNPKYKKRIISN